MISADGHWRVSAIKRDGQLLFRVERDEPVATPLAQGGTIRTGNGWWLAGELTPAQAMQSPLLAELAEEE